MGFIDQFSHVLYSLNYDILGHAIMFDAHIYISIFFLKIHIRIHNRSIQISNHSYANQIKQQNGKFIQYYNQITIHNH